MVVAHAHAFTCRRHASSCGLKRHASQTTCATLSHSPHRLTRRARIAFCTRGRTSHCGVVPRDCMFGEISCSPPSTAHGPHPMLPAGHVGCTCPVVCVGFWTCQVHQGCLGGPVTRSVCCSRRNPPITSSEIWIPQPDPRQASLGLNVIATVFSCPSAADDTCSYCYVIFTFKNGTCHSQHAFGLSLFWFGWCLLACQRMFSFIFVYQDAW